MKHQRKPKILSSCSVALLVLVSLLQAGLHAPRRISNDDVDRSCPTGSGHGQALRRDPPDRPAVRCPQVEVDDSLDSQTPEVEGDHQWLSLALYGVLHHAVMETSPLGEVRLQCSNGSSALETSVEYQPAEKEGQGSRGKVEDPILQEDDLFSFDVGTEACLSIAGIVGCAREGFNGIVNIYPFTCMRARRVLGSRYSVRLMATK